MGWSNETMINWRKKIFWSKHIYRKVVVFWRAKWCTYRLKKKYKHLHRVSEYEFLSNGIDQYYNNFSNENIQMKILGNHMQTCARESQIWGDLRPLPPPPTGNMSHCSPPFQSAPLCHRHSHQFSQNQQGFSFVVLISFPRVITWFWHYQ